MNPQFAAKKYARTAVCVINGAFNTNWDEEAAKNKLNPLFPSTPQTNFRKAHQEDHIVFAITQYTNGTKMKAPRPQGRQGDNKPNIPTTAILNGLPGPTPGDVQNMIQILGVEMGEGAVQAGGSGRTANLEGLSFYPGSLIGGFVPDKKEKDQDMVYIVPRVIDPKDKKCPLLDRGRTFVALEWLHADDTDEGRNAFPMEGDHLVVPGNRGQPTHAVKTLLHCVFNNVMVMVGTGSVVDKERNMTLKGLDEARKKIEVYIDHPSRVEIDETIKKILPLVNAILKGLRIAYEADVKGKSSIYSKIVIEPFEKFVMDQIEEKLNIMRQAFGIVVAPVSSDTKWIPFNFCGYSR